MKGRIRDMGRGYDGSLTVTLSLPPQYAEPVHALMQDMNQDELSSALDVIVKEAARLNGDAS